MVLTKQQNVLKALVEHMLSRNVNPSEEHRKDVVMGLKILKSILPEGELFVITTAHRLAADFANAIKWPSIKVRHIAHTDMIKGIDFREKHIIQLHTGSRTVEQSRIHHEIMDYLCAIRHNPVIWHIGDWRP